MESKITDLNQDLEAPEESNYFSVSTTKLVVMSICSLGLYDLYWFYNNWQHIKKTKEEYSDISPFWRSLFAPLWAYSCLTHIQNECKKQEFHISLYCGFSAVIYFLLQASWKLPAPYMLISFFTFVPLLAANIATTKVNRKVNSNYEQNSRFKGWNWLALTVGSVLVLLNIVSAFVHPQV